MAVSRAWYLADKSALARATLPVVAERLTPLVELGFVATCAVVDLEVLYSARSAADYEAIREERTGFEDLPMTPAVADRAKHLQRQLARSGHHRVPIPDLLVSAAAAEAGVTVLHYDADFERIAAAGGAEQEWVVPRGSI